MGNEQSNGQNNDLGNLKNLSKDKDHVAAQQKASDSSANSKSLSSYKCKYSVDSDGVTFYPSPHLSEEEDICTKQLETTSFLKSQRMKDIQKKTKFVELEAVSDWDLQIVDDGTANISPFILGAVKAFNNHYPFKISPNNIFLMILQAIAVNVDKNSEKLRTKFVAHSGKMKLTVKRDSRDFKLRKQCRTNDWGSVIGEFVEQIDENTVKDTALLMQAQFSDSDMVDVVSNKITIMDICKNYFEYEFICVPGCGFPKITLSGTKDDWTELKAKVNALLSTKVDKEWGEQWKHSLLPVLDRFIGAFDGKIDCLFWNSMIKAGVTVKELASSGGPMYQRDHWFSGWFNVLFPYICRQNGDYVDNQYCRPYSEEESYANGEIGDAGKGGNDIKVYPMGLSSAPVKTLYIDAETKRKYEYEMTLISGCVGYRQCPKTCEISPATAWVIAYDK